MTFKKHIHYSQELEMAILGACILEGPAFGRTYGLIEDETFYFDSHQVVYRSMRKMYDSGAPIDLFTVTDYIIRNMGIDVFHGVDVSFFVTKLTTNVVSSANLEYHCHIIKSMWVEREITKLTHGGFSSSRTSREKIIELQERLQELNKRNVTSDWVDMTELMVKLYQHQAEMEMTGGMGITTGFNKLDRNCGGFHPGQLIVIGARPSVGKSALAGHMAIEMAQTGKTVGIISLEMHNNEVAARIASLDTNTDFDALYRGLYVDENQRMAVYKRIGNHTAHLPIYVSDKTDVNINEIRAKASKLKHIHGLDCLMIDYLQLVDSDETKNSNRENEIRKISRGSKIMAKEMGIPVIELCQLNRNVTHRKGQERYPQLSDLRESGAIEQDADVVIFLHRDWMSGHEQDENGNSTERQADLVIRKWRNGNSNFILPLDFDPPKMKFSQREELGSFPSGNWRPVSGIKDFTETKNERMD